MLKKIICAVASALVCVPVASLSANAVMSDYSIQSSDYAAMPELAEYADNRLENSEYSCVSNVYVKNIDKYTSERIVELCRKDFVNIEISSDVSVEAVKEEICGNFDRTVEIYGYDRNQYQDYTLISLSYASTDHDGNIELTKEITKFLESKYQVTESTGVFDSKSFLSETVHWDLIRPSDPYDTHKLTEAEILRLNEYLSGVNAYFDANTQRMILSEDMTELEKYQLNDSLNEIFDLTFNTYGLADIETTEGKTIDFLSAFELKGDSNCDGKVSISDSVAILQYIADYAKYPLSPQGKINADCDGSDGITGLDAAAIQKFDAEIIDFLSETLS